MIKPVHLVPKLLPLTQTATLHLVEKEQDLAIYIILHSFTHQYISLPTVFYCFHYMSNKLVCPNCKIFAEFRGIYYKYIKKLYTHIVLCILYDI